MLFVLACVLVVAATALVLLDRQRKRPSAAVRRPSLLPLLAFALLAALALSRVSGLGKAGFYGVIMFTVLGAKLCLSSVHRAAPTPSAVDTSAWRVAVVLPFYNEDPDLVRDGLRSLLIQTRVPDELWLIDDGSDDAATRSAVTQMRSALAAVIPAVEVIRFRKNRGKREALAYAFRASSADVFVTLDSDTVLDREAIAEILKPLADDTVSAVTGLVGASNRRRNLLTRLIDLRYANAFLYERAAYSALGAVLCCCGSLSAYRGDVVRAELDDFLDQRFLGARAVYGDDRRLTNYALLRGRVVLQETARAWTAVPERLGHFLRQQARWNKSFFRESVWVIQNLPVRSAPFALTAVELATWLVFTAMLFAAVVLHPLRTGQALAMTYVAYAALMSYGRSLRYFEAPSAGDSRLFRAVTFFLAPLYALVHLAVLMPLRLYSLLTLRRAAWGTRARVEVKLDPRRAAWGIPGAPLLLLAVGTPADTLGLPHPRAVAGTLATVTAPNSIVVPPIPPASVGSAFPALRSRPAMGAVVARPSPWGIPVG
jgi:hyaluronan synthase